MTWQSIQTVSDVFSNVLVRSILVHARFSGSWMIMCYIDSLTYLLSYRVVVRRSRCRQTVTTYSRACPSTWLSGRTLHRPTTTPSSPSSLSVKLQYFPRLYWSNVLCSSGRHKFRGCSLFITHWRSIAERGGCFQWCLFVCQFVCLSTR